MSSLGEAARHALKNMDARKYEYQSDFARQYIAQGRAEGEAQGRAEGEAHGRAALVIRQLTSRFGPIGSLAEARIRRASIAELEDIGDRLLTARTLQDALACA
jgi:flagellar biosynthesis/type III secretory pathway protein FliH